MSLSDNVLLIRKKKGLSQADLGKMITTFGDVVNRYKREDISPSLEVISKIADALKVSAISNFSDGSKRFALNHIVIALRNFKVKSARLLIQVAITKAV